jgi:hypothetical protein
MRHTRSWLWSRLNASLHKTQITRPPSGDIAAKCFLKTSVTSSRSLRHRFAPPRKAATAMRTLSTWWRRYL